MSSLLLFLKSTGLGIAIAAPVGPIAIICIRRTLSDGFTSGLATGMGAATADGIYAALAAFGLTVVIELLIGASPLIQPIGGLFLFYIGARLFWTKRCKSQPINMDRSSLFSNYSKTMILTLANPLTIVTFLGIVTALDIKADSYAAFLTTAGILIGSALWHLLLVSGFSLAKSFLKPKYFDVINYLSGLALILLGASMVMQCI